MRKKLGEILVSSGAVSLADIEGALDDQSAGEPSRLGDLLLAAGKITSAQLGQALAEQYGLPYVELTPLPQAVLELVPFELQRQFRFLPLRSDGTELTIAMADLANLEVVATLEQTWTRVHVCVAGGDEVDAVLASVAGLFGASPGVVLPSVAPAIAPTVAPGPSAADLFGGLDEPPGELALASSPSPVPAVAPVAPAQGPRPSPAPAVAPPRAEDLFGDLNLDSARLGIAARSPEATALSLDAVGGPLEAPPPDEEADDAPPVVAGQMLPESAEAPEPAEPVLEAERLPEGTGPIIEGLHEGTGPVVDVPFFTDLPMSDAPAVLPAPTQAPPPSAEPPLTALPDWLRAEGPTPVAPPLAPPPGHAAPSTAGWTGALEHLAPSKLAQGVARVLLAKGLITEQEVLDALERKK